MSKILIFILLFAWNYLVLRLAFEVGGWWKETEDDVRIRSEGTRINKDE